MKTIIILIILSVLSLTCAANSRIVGGQDAIPHSAPWIITIQWGPHHHCGGSILRPEWVVTAAHCLFGISPQVTLTLIAGIHTVRSPEPSAQRRVLNRNRIWIHEQWVSGPFDIAMVHVAPAFVFNQFVQPIALPNRNYIHSGIVQLHGWGLISGTQLIFPTVLQTVLKPIIPINQCRAVLGPSTHRQLHETNICTGPLHGGISACTGDSGGSLVQNRQLVGITSWGINPCGSANAPSVYVRVSAFIDWINNIMNHN